MSLNKKQIQDLFTDIRTGKAALLLGQEYFRIDEDYYEKVLYALNRKDDKPSLNELWESGEPPYDALKSALYYAAENSDYKPWLRTLLSLGWNIVLSSSINNEWVKNGVGPNFSLIIQTQTELPDNVDFYKTFSKNQPHYISLYSDEKSIPPKIELLKLKKRTTLLDMIYNQMLSSYDGYLVADGIAEDDWFDIGRLTENIGDTPYGCIFIFGMDNERLEKVCNNANDLMLLQEYIKNGQIILFEKSLKETIIELGLVTEDEEADEDEHDNEVRIRLANDDSLWVSRRECSRLNKISITLMRDEILNQLIMTDDNKEKYFADFLQQRDKKNWNYFDISYKRKRTTFHIKRQVEGLLENAVIKQLGSSNNKREIILLKGNSNSGKTTSLSWFAWHAVKEGFKKKKDEKYIVIYISGDPSYYDKEWQDILSEFIKNNIYNKPTVKGDRIRNVIIVWDNYNGRDKKSDYIQLYNKLNECNAILIGSIYLFESSNNNSSIVQGVAFNELQPLSSKLEDNAKDFKILLSSINPNWASQVEGNYLFENIINIAKYNYSQVWEQVRQTMRAGLSKEALLTEKVSDDLFNIFKNKNADDFTDVAKTVFGLGIGAKIQSQFIKTDIEKQKKNILFINSIRDMNLILAVAGQFKKVIRLPVSVLLKTILQGKEYRGECEKLKKILRSDSMVEFDFNNSTNNALVSFRHPSEAIAYLENNFGADRKRKEIDVIIRIIRNCRWDVFEEAKAVSAFVRSFGTNSYGKYGEEKPNTHGHYNEYSEYWLEIVQALRQCATDNAEAMLIAGHFTRDHVETYPSNNDLIILNTALEGMLRAVDSCTIKSTCSRLWGEICRNLLQQIKITDDITLIEDYSNEFEEYFEYAVKSGKESSLNNKDSSMIQLLDIWLNYVLNDKERQNQLIPDTLEYIDLLFYNESSLIDDSEDYVNVISNINRIYEIINSKNGSDLREIFANSNNDSYIYCIAKQVLVRTYFDCKEKYPDLFSDKNGYVLSSRVFFLNENAANDFYQIGALKNNNNSEENYEINKDRESNDVNVKFTHIKRKLHDASEELIKILEDEYSSVEEMSYRCLVLYLKAKWMYYTNNLLLEHGQTPALSDARWRELNRICTCIVSNKRDNDVVPRSAVFIQNIFGFVFEEKKWNLHRPPSEMPNRLICLCTEYGVPRLFNISTYLDNYNKLKAQIDCEVINGKTTKEPCIVGKKNIYVPENVKDYRELKRTNLNVNKNYAIWFNLGGPEIQDNGRKEGV
ncbi:MAG: hypothetical protein ACI4JA_04140 [Oscillospiraceae bacterium]